MNQIISIKNDKDITTEKVLCEWGQQHCCIAGWSGSENRATEIRYYTFPKLNTDIIRSMIENIQQINSEVPVYFSSEYAEALLIPSKFSEKGEELIHQFFPGTKIILKDSVEQWQAIVAHAVPQILGNELATNYSFTNFTHGFATSLKVYNGFIANDSLSVHFTPYNFRVIARKDGQLLLTQMYMYQIPLDVVYYLLKICEEFSLPKDILYVVVSGLIEESSALYTELTNYFQTVQFAATAPIVADAVHPAHYFTSLYNLSACVS